MIGFAQRLLRDTRAAALPETAIATIFLVPIFLGVIGMGDSYQRVQVLNAAARDAARYLARTTNPTANVASAQAVARCGALTCTDATARACYIVAGSTTVTTRTVANTGAYRGPNPITIVQARVAPTFTSACPAPFIAAAFSSVGFNYVGVHEQRVIGQ